MSENHSSFSPGRANEQRRARIAETFRASPHQELSHFQPEILGEGQNRTVFELVRSDCERSQRGVVIKVDRGACEVAVKDIIRTGRDDISLKTREIFSKRLVSERYGRKAFQEAFKEFAIPERCFLRRIPIPSGAIREFLPSIVLPENFSEMHEVTTLVYVQQRVPHAAFAEGSSEFRFRYSERDRAYDDETLFQANRVFLDGHTSLMDVSRITSFDPHFREVLAQARYDAPTRKLLCRLLDAAYEYTKQTGNILDFFGPDNARIYTDTDGQQKLALVDAYIPGRIFARAQEALRAAALGYEMSHNEVLAIVSAVSYARNMNAIALIVNSPHRFRLLQSDVAPLLRILSSTIRRELSAP